MTPTELAEHVAKRKELWEACSNSGNSVPENRERERPEGFAAEIANATGVTKRAINKAVSRADAIPLSVRAKIKGTKLATGVYLDSLKKLSADAR